MSYILGIRVACSQHRFGATGACIWLAGHIVHCKLLEMCKVFMLAAHGCTSRALEPPSFERIPSWTSDVGHSITLHGCYITRLQTNALSSSLLACKAIVWSLVRMSSIEIAFIQLQFTDLPGTMLENLKQLANFPDRSVHDLVHSFWLFLSVCNRAYG